MEPQFNSFTATGKGLLRVLVTEVHVSAVQPNAPPGLGFNKFNGIWDTGATNSVITQKVVDACNLKPISMAKVQHADGESVAEVYLVNIGLPNRVAFPSLRVTKGKISSIDVLIGMDIIGSGDLAVTNFDGKTVFSFRMPSGECIDFVKRPPEVVRLPGVGRNDPCTCGSGKKFKQCCGKGF